MPELPEVETVVREIRPGIVGRRIVRVQVSRKALRRPWLRRWNERITGLRIQSVARRGKWILIELERELRLVMHLGMTGQLTVEPSKTRPRPHTHLIFNLDHHSTQLRFRDVRRFGCASLFDSPEEVESFFEENRLGPEPFDLSAEYWHTQLSKTERCLKAVLLDQRIVAGVGNIYADESLFEAGLHPSRLASSVTQEEAARLGQAVKAVLTRAIEKRGSSIRDYIGGSGEKGEFQDEFKVYACTSRPCTRCDAPIARIVLAGRSTHFCRMCQPLKRRKSE